MKLFHCLKLGSVGRIQLQKVTWDPSNGWTIWCVNYVSMKLLGKKSHEAHTKYLTESSLTRLLPCHQAYKSGSSAIKRGEKNQESDEHEHSWRNANTSTAGWPAALRSESGGDAPQFQEETAAEGAFGAHQPELTTGCLHSDPQGCKTLTYKGDFWKGWTHTKLFRLQIRECWVFWCNLKTMDTTTKMEKNNTTKETYL